MSQENVEIVRASFELGANEGLDALAERYWDATIEYCEDPRWPGASTYRGREAVVQCFRDYFEALGAEDVTNIAVERVLDASDRGVVAFVRFSGRASASGLPHEHLWGYVVKVEGERIVYFRAYYEPTEALEAVGLSDQDAHARET
jgi:ketosteroid isomerase-like protein